MVVERFRDGCYELVYERYRTRGRMLPEGLHYLNSWTNRDNNICFQLMETADQSLFDQWIPNWQDLVEFDVYPVDAITASTIVNKESR